MFKSLNLRACLEEAEKKGVAIGHFNISDLAALRAIFEAAKELGVPVLIGTSEGERAFLGPRQAVALVKGLREEFNYPVFLNADHTHSFEKIKEAVEAGYDAVLFDGGKLSLEENIKETKRVVEYVKSVNSAIVVEGELGYIGSSSEVLTALPVGVALSASDFTTPEQAAQFVKETGVDLLAPAVGNIHGIVRPPGSTKAEDPPLDIARVKAINDAVIIPLVLHGASGNTDEDIRSAIKAGAHIVHINTELRLAWRRGLERGFKENPNEVAPYKILSYSEAQIKEVVMHYLALFSGT